MMNSVSDTCKLSYFMIIKLLVRNSVEISIDAKFNTIQKLFNKLAQNTLQFMNLIYSCYFLYEMFKKVMYVFE